MEKHLGELQKQYEELYKLQTFREEDLDYSRLDYHVEYLENIHIMKNSSIAIFDLYKREHVFISSRNESILGYGSDRIFRDPMLHLAVLIHPDDLLILTKNGLKYFRLGIEYARNNKNIHDYKYITDYRIRKKSGKYVRVVEQHILLETDKSNNLWLAMSVMDLSPDNDLATPCRVRLLNTRTGELFTFQDEENGRRGILSKREKEILHLISEGMPSKLIADKLFISTHTVNTHRQNIIEKMKVNNSAEAVQYASRLGLLD
ncbi:MAG: LuxR C-terminal-related transcriptional regulator [Bacteroidales bacterium]|nr:LuxR C-terminal-related transcriptional regulator [Bacteroidales bacterium]MCF8350489.1 LuxR C-terminal-related transcriptional regulator [Bacteroidales bacterium]MCF8375680.1 LuxR C-terminal-related transcriptional regulator [Bacteroidales bacterium]MCF8401478.1 LuxR C-terminal-related transcriptional regulator [Bacteroidales bacterium]